MPDDLRDPIVTHWKIYYGDGTEWSPADGYWTDAPDTDVQVVVLWRADGAKRMMRGADHYWYDPKIPSSAFGLTDNPNGCRGCVKTGRWLSDEYWSVVLLRAMADMQFLDPPPTDTA